MIFHENKRFPPAVSHFAALPSSVFKRVIKNHVSLNVVMVHMPPPVSEIQQYSWNQFLKVEEAGHPIGPCYHVTDRYSTVIGCLCHVTDRSRTMIGCLCHVTEYLELYRMKVWRGK